MMIAAGLLAGVEFCCRGGDDKVVPCLGGGGRSYRLENVREGAVRWVEYFAEKLRVVGVVPIGSLKTPLFREVQKKELELETRTYADVTKSRAGRIGDKVGKWCESITRADFLKHWASQAWLLKGKRRVKDNELILEKWHPEVGCLGIKSWLKAWTGFSFLNSAGGGIGMLFNPAMVEVQPWYSQVMPAGSGCRRGDTEIEDEEGSGLGDVCRGSMLEKEARLWSRREFRVSACGSSSREATVFSMELAAWGLGTVNRQRSSSRGIQVRVKSCGGWGVRDFFSLLLFLGVRGFGGEGHLGLDETVVGVGARANGNGSGTLFISCRFKNVEDGFRWTFSGLFLNEREEEQCLLDEISEVIDELELRDLPSGGRLPGVRIDAEEAARLEEAFTEEEVFSTLSNMNGDKAPGPDGFSLSFWQFSWEFVKVEVMGFFKDSMSVTDSLIRFENQLDKSEILLVGRVENLELLALEVGCKVGRLPTSYLGIPLGRIISPWPFGMEWKKGSGKGLPSGKGNLS
ncbi:hypothetical protein CK203_056319 [Vitis vinifera]|uniref:DUF4283 domain-containing protein n=1 Tax=Vitis vinifera TaxID=29760 RepID=A0A438GNY2_VITVI|nr:hypothetical protein CK203_056319 [Vitis vinifera]